MNSKIAESIMREYEKKKKYEANIERKELEKFKSEICVKCKNKITQLCHIVKNVDNKYNCPYKNI